MDKTQINGNGHTPPAVSFSEAPASATIRVTSPGGYDLMLTFRATRVADLLAQAQTVEGWLIAHNFAPAPTHKPSKASQGDQGETPTCPEHGKPMKSGRSGFYCPVEVGKHPQSGKPLYCQHTVKGGA